MGRYELTDAQWALVEGQLPRSEGVGRPWRDHRPILNGIFWILRSGAPWRDLPERYGKWQSVHARFTRWRDDGTWDKLLTHLRATLDTQGEPVAVALTRPRASVCPSCFPPTVP